VPNTDNRKTPQNADEQAAAFRTVIAYTGKYRIEGEKFITNVDVAWNPAPGRYPAGSVLATAGC
jgi:hypothetical protein